jgi:hypothetical protein
MWSRLVHVTALDRNGEALLLLLEHGADSGVDRRTWGSVHACTRQCGCHGLGEVVRRQEMGWPYWRTRNDTFVFYG